MPRRERTDGRHATLFTRKNLPRPATRRREAVAAELAAVADGGSLDAFDVVYWDKRVPVEGESTRERYLVEVFERWAEEAGACLAPCFDTRRCYDDGSGRVRDELVMPVLCLAVYEGDRLVEVAPRGHGGEVVTVADCLERLAAEESDRPGRDPLTPTAD